MTPRPQKPFSELKPGETFVYGRRLYTKTDDTMATPFPGLGDETPVGLMPDSMVRTKD